MEFAEPSQPGTEPQSQGEGGQSGTWESRVSTFTFQPSHCPGKALGVTRMLLNCGVGEDS